MKLRERILVMTVLVGVAALGALPAACAGDLLAKLQSIRIEKIDVQDVSVDEVFKQLRATSKELDPDHEGVNFVFKPCANGDTSFRKRNVTISFKRLPLGEVIRYVCLSAGLHYGVEDSAVVVADQSVSLAGMETRFYRVEAGVLDAPRTRKAKPLKGPGEN
ncbi:MAG: hypothetical protein A3K19_05085 [Lentisphaerae bacterium RIFOXYB12_FULL_65_16]|nr:MAG: hypothetical protein A3K18_35265 [Lentisphaerae bacterium RIFOXYA12_64_32]OGV89763.1 MAG: hypothetical protein A3K19_05085 [Lentisphaerae bacterium RIFOXYB12_FULL_65_16]